MGTEVDRRKNAERDNRPEIVPFEINVEESFLFAGGGPSSKGVREYGRRIHLASGGQQALGWRFTPSEELGDVGEFDRDVYVAVGFLAQQRGGLSEDGKIAFSLYDLVKILNLSDNGQSYKAVRDSIVRLQKLLIDADLYVKDLGAYEAKHFTMWSVHFKANAGKRGKAVEHHTLRFDDTVIRNFQAGYVKQLDVNFYFSLDQAHARSLYGRIDIERGDGLRWEVRTSDLKGALGMAPSYKSPSAIKRALERAHKELGRKGFLRAVTFPERDLISYEISDAFLNRASNPERTWTEEENEAIRALMRNEVWPNVARTLVRNHGPVLCNYYVHALPYQKNVREPGAWLSRCIKDKLPLRVEPPQRSLDESEIPAYPASKSNPPAKTSSARSTSSPRSTPGSAARRREGYEWLFGE